MHAVRRLPGELSHGDAEARRQAIRALGALRDHEALPGLLAGLEDPDPAVRYEAVMALDALDDPAALPSLIRVAHTDLAEDVRAAALRIIPRMAW